MRSLMICFLMLAACGDASEKLSNNSTNTSSSLPSGEIDSNPPDDRRCKSINAIVGDQKIFVPSSCAPSQIDVGGDPAIDRQEIDPRQDLPTSIEQNNTL